MNHLQAPDVTYISSFIAMYAGTMAWLNDNSGAIGAICAIVGATVAVATFWRGRKRD